MDDTSHIEAINQTISNGLSSSKIGLIIAIIGLLIFAAHLFSSIFSRRRIPDVLFLIIIGLALGPLTHLVDSERLTLLGAFFRLSPWC